MMYELIAVRYKETPEGSVMRREFLPKQMEEAQAFADSLVARGAIVLSAEGIKIQYGGSEVQQRHTPFTGRINK